MSWGSPGSSSAMAGLDPDLVLGSAGLDPGCNACHPAFKGPPSCSPLPPCCRGGKKEEEKEVFIPHPLTCTGKGAPPGGGGGWGWGAERGGEGGVL